MLSTSDIERYQRDGYVIVPDLLRPPQIAALQAVIDRWMTNASTVDTHDADCRPQWQLPHQRGSPSVTSDWIKHCLRQL